MNSNEKKPVKVLIELPTWLGDCVMSTPAIENIANYFSEIEITVFGSKTSVELIKKPSKSCKFNSDRFTKSIFI
ncbi:hypothetical protein N9I31_04280 [Candidatus Pseudothioglobus singularis]|nr:hypothetical protein [Candidatus Pseudothioglobus singularis]